MDVIKSKLSLKLLTSISPIIMANSEKIVLSTADSILLLLKDINPSYDFFFRIEKEEISIIKVNKIRTITPTKGIIIADLREIVFLFI